MRRKFIVLMQEQDDNNEIVHLKVEANDIASAIHTAYEQITEEQSEHISETDRRATIDEMMEWWMPLYVLDDGKLYTVDVANQYTAIDIS